MYATSPDDTALHALAHPPARRAVDARHGVRQLVSRTFFASSAVVAALCALLFLLLPAEPLDRAHVLAATAFGALALPALAGLRARGPWVERTMFGLLALATLAIAATARLLGWGLATPGLAFYGLFVCVLCTTTASWRMGVGLAAIEVAALLFVAFAASGGAPAGAAPGDAMRLATHLLLVAIGLAGGLLISHVVARYLRSADDREQRFRSLLGIAADAYWEIDEQYRLVTGTDQHEPAHSLQADDGLGRVPWELPRFGCDGETLDALIADLDTRLPFRDRLVHWQTRDGKARALRVSGEPRFDDRGIFKGYWGVARDVSAEVAAARTLAATETRYQELFAHIPTPLVLHRDGRVIDANPAALALFGCDGLEALLGRDLLADYESGDSRERERRRFEELAEQAAGESLPVADFRLLLRNGRRVAARAAAVRVEADGALATLTIYVDDTERRTAEEAVRRSEAMLSHLVATSPDLITLTDLTTGRYVMVNKAFERITGYGAAEVVGRTSFELGIWQQAEDRERFIAALKEHGNADEMPARFITKKGTPVEMLISGARFAMDRREYLVINARDISAAERHRLEREALLENASIGIAFTREQRFVLANPRFEQMFSWERGTLAGEPGRVIWPDDGAYDEVGRAIGPVLARGEAVEFEHVMQRRDGSSFVCRTLAKAVDPRRPTQGGTIWIVEDVTERRQFEQTLAAARDAAEAASRAKSSFLANTSHELRTPLNGLLHLAEMARESKLEEGRRRQYLDQIVDSARALAGIISDILDLSKIEAGKLELEATTFDLGALLATLQRAYTTLASSRDLALEFEVGDGVAGAAGGVVTGDPLRVRQILSNYLGNALKFTAAGTVRLRASRHGDRVRFEVQDSGPGIDRATQERLFRPFTQADESTTRRFGGTGLGLSICRELGALMGGTVGVVSEAGAGSTFWAEIPLPKSLAPAVAAAPEAATDRDLKGVRVLMVEDNPVNMMIASAILERWGVEVEQASDGRQAIDAVQRAASVGQDFDAVLMDVQMPVMSGYEATRALRRRREGQRLPIIALTAAALVSEREAAMEAGMNDFLTKPIDADKLREAVARWASVRH